MKKIGIIGGVGPQATSALYSQIIEFSRYLYGAEENHEFPKIIIESVPIYDFISDTNKIKLAKKELIFSVRNLEKAGATKLAIASNTVHLLLDDLRSSTSVEFVSMIEAVVNECKNKKLKKVGIVASPMTLDQGLYDIQLEENNIKLIKPTHLEIKVVEQMIRYYLAGKSNGKYKTMYLDVLNRLFEKGCEAVILGCTELPLVIDYQGFEDKVIDSSKVLARELVNYYYN